MDSLVSNFCVGSTDIMRWMVYVLAGCLSWLFDLHGDPHTHLRAQVYMDWANHYLRKTGHSATLSDLKEISDGLFLPQIIQAVGKKGRERERERER